MAHACAAAAGGYCAPFHGLVQVQMQQLVWHALQQPPSNAAGMLSQQPLGRCTGMLMQQPSLHTAVQGRPGPGTCCCTCALPVHSRHSRLVTHSACSRPSAHLSSRCLPMSWR